jgi:hypothetical protein
MVCQQQGCGRSQTRTWTARDGCGNTSTAARTVTWTADVTPPVITTGGTTTTLGCNPSAGDINGALGTATATDACGVPTLSSNDGNVTSDGCGRSQTRTWTARDACGNTSTASRTVTWTADLTSPVLLQVVLQQLLDVILLQVISMVLWVLQLQLTLAVFLLYLQAMVMLQVMVAVVLKQEHGLQEISVVTHLLHHVL